VSALAKEKTAGAKDWKKAGLLESGTGSEQAHSKRQEGDTKSSNF